MRFFRGNMPRTPEEVPAYLDELTMRLTEILSQLEQGHLEILYRAPDSPQAGQLIYADGTDWNPGSGEGLYRYSIAGSWVYIG